MSSAQGGGARDAGQLGRSRHQYTVIYFERFLFSFLSQNTHFMTIERRKLLVFQQHATTRKRENPATLDSKRNKGRDANIYHDQAIQDAVLGTYGMMMLERRLSDASVDDLALIRVRDSHRAGWTSPSLVQSNGTRIYLPRQRYLFFCPPCNVVGSSGSGSGTLRARVPKMRDSKRGVSLPSSSREASC
jgi:hypothetical protein